MFNLSTAIKLVGLIIFSLFISACGGGGGSGSVTQPPASASNFLHVKMHYDLLKNQPFVWGEHEGAPMPITLSSYVAKGGRILNVSSTANLKLNQLITYHSSDGNYYVGKISALPNTQKIILASALEGPVSSGINAWDFYQDSTPHPNIYGFRAVADYTIKSLGFGSQTGGKHVLLGDSWFDERTGESVVSRLRQKLSGAVLINRGTGGETSQDMLTRFDTDVAPQNPEYVWILAGTNDYWKGLTKAQYKANLNTLISKSKAIGAKVIVIDCSVGIGTGNTGVPNKQQSDAYANAVLELY